MQGAQRFITGINYLRERQTSIPLTPIAFTSLYCVSNFNDANRTIIVSTR